MSTIIYTNYNYDMYMLAAQESLECDFRYSGEEFTDDDVYSLAQTYNRNDWDDWFSPALTDYLNSHTVVVRGSIGRWNGHSYGGDVISSRKGLDNYLEDCAYIEISQDNDGIYIDGSHHDGTVSIAMRELTNEGIEWYREHEDDEPMYVIDELFYEYSKKPQINW